MRRREFLAVAAWCLSRGARATVDQASRPRAIRLGGPIFLKSDDPAELAHESIGAGATARPIVPRRPSATGTGSGRSVRPSPPRSVVIAEVGAWRNMLDPDAQKRADNLKYVTDRLALADAVEARCCVDIAGSYNPDRLVRGAPKESLAGVLRRDRRELPEGDRRGQAARDDVLDRDDGVEPAGRPGHLPEADSGSGPAGVRGPHGRVQRHQLAGLASTSNAEFIDECFAKLGKWIVSCHAKDLAWIPEYNVHFREVVPGKGQIDYAEYLRQLVQTRRGCAADARALADARRSTRKGGTTSSPSVAVSASHSPRTV